MKLLNEGPYIIVKLSLEEKRRLSESEVLNPDGENKFDLRKSWYITNDPNMDSEWDGRDDFWKNGEEYPYPYALLIGGCDVDHHYDSFSEHTLVENDLLKYFKK